MPNRASPPAANDPRVNDPRVTPVAVLKRNGGTAGFQPERIARAIAAAGEATQAFDLDEAWRLTHAVILRLGARVPTVEHVQDVVEQVLLDAGHTQPARAYIVYREKHKQLRADRKTLMDVAASINEYLEQQDWRVLGERSGEHGALRARPWSGRARRSSTASPAR